MANFHSLNNLITFYSKILSNQGQMIKGALRPGGFKNPGPFTPTLSSRYFVGLFFFNLFSCFFFIRSIWAFRCRYSSYSSKFRISNSEVSLNNTLSVSKVLTSYLANLGILEVIHYLKDRKKASWHFDSV